MQLVGAAVRVVVDEAQSSAQPFRVGGLRAEVDVENRLGCVSTVPVPMCALRQTGEQNLAWCGRGTQRSIRRRFS